MGVSQIGAYSPLTQTQPTGLPQPAPPTQISGVTQAPSFPVRREIQTGTAGSGNLVGQQRATFVSTAGAYVNPFQVKPGVAIDPNITFQLQKPSGEGGAIVPATAPQYGSFRYSGTAREGQMRTRLTGPGQTESIREATTTITPKQTIDAGKKARLLAGEPIIADLQQTTTMKPFTQDVPGPYGGLIQVSSRTF